MFFDIWRQKRENIIATPISNTDRTLRLRKFCWLNLEKTKKQKTSRKPKNQKAKTFQRMFGLRLMFGFFGFSSSFFGFFGHYLEKTKKTQGFFGFLKELLLEVRQKTKKLRSFLVFGQIFRRHVTTTHAKNQKRPEFFLVFHNSLTIHLSKKNKKNLEFF